MNYPKLIIEINVEGKVYRQPDCRIKTTSDGFIMCLIRNESSGKWIGVKGLVTIKGLVIRKEYYYDKNRRIPMWLLKLFSVKI